MSRDTLRRLLDAGLRDPRTGEAVRVPTRSVAIEESLEGREAELVLELGLGPRLAVVSDPETERVLGRRVRQALSAPATGLRVRPVLLPAHPRPDARTAEALRRESREDAARLNARLEAEWDGIRRRIAAVVRPRRFLEGVLRRAGAARTPGELGWPGELYRRAVRRAREVRSRYTFLDLAADSGLLERFAPARPR
jgi:hypothetical protein